MCEEKEKDAERYGTPKLGVTAQPKRVRGVPLAELREIVASAGAACSAVGRGVNCAARITSRRCVRAKT